MSLLDRIKKASKIEYTSEIGKSKVLTEREIISTPIPALNIAFGGSLDGGFTSGLTVWQGESKTFKTLFSLVCAKAYMDKYDDAVLLFYDSEMGASLDYFNSMGIDTSRVVHTPVTNIEEWKFDIMAQLDELKKGDHVIIILDSIGNLASKKEVEDALAEKSAVDMTRAKMIKSVLRMITPVLSLKEIPMIMINHCYQSQGLFPTEVGAGGRGIVYAAQNIYTVSKSQEKKGTDIIGYNFNLNVTKSRFSREKSRIPVTVTYEGGINKWSGLLDMAIAAGIVVKPSNGWYQAVDTETGELIGNKLRAADTNTSEFWEPILNNEKFKKWVIDNFSVASGQLLADTVPTLENAPNPDFTMEDEE